MIAIVTDSSVGYSTAEVTSRGILSVVPLNYQIGNGFYEEYASDRNGDFMTPMAQFSPCKTAQPNFDNFLRTFRTLTERGCDVICIVLSEALSGTYSSAKFAAQQAGGNIYVYRFGHDRRGHAPLVDEAVNMVKGGFSFETVVKQRENIKRKIGIVFTVETLDRLRAGGRLNSARAKAQLNVRPVFEMKERILFKENTRGHRERLEAMCALFPENTRRLIVCPRCGAGDGRLRIYAAFARAVPRREYPPARAGAGAEHPCRRGRVRRGLRHEGAGQIKKTQKMTCAAL